MNKRITIVLFLAFASVASVFAQSVEDKKEVDIQSNSTVEAEEQIFSVEPIKPELSPFYHPYPMLLKNNPILTDFYRFRQSPILNISYSN